jgi:hypothetical protein
MQNRPLKLDVKMNLKFGGRVVQLMLSSIFMRDNMTEMILVTLSCAT